jgi:hypothetical protein
MQRVQRDGSNTQELDKLHIPTSPYTVEGDRIGY